jgi:hypothetical protein
MIELSYNRDEVIMKMKFVEVQVGTFFSCNGNDYLKRTSRTAFNVWNHEIFYFKSNTLVKNLGKNPRLVS